ERDRAGEAGDVPRQDGGRSVGQGPEGRRGGGSRRARVRRPSRRTRASPAPQMIASVFVGTSLDGFIARLDGGLDWLPEGGGEDHGYPEFLATVDALVIGRKTYETVLGFGAWPYGDRPVFVLSTRPLASPPAGARVERM